MDREAYYKHFGWKKSPFIKSSSMEIPFIEREQEYREVCECLGGWDRIISVTAPIGFGKTTFMNILVKNKPTGVDYLTFFDAYEPVDEVMGRVLNALPLWKRFTANRIDRTAFGKFLQKRLGGKKMLLLFDEAQDYQEDVFKWLRILNDRTDNVFMVFFGLPSLEDKITSEASFRDRKAKSIKLKPFTNEELCEIVRKRVCWVGGEDPKPFTENSLKRLCGASRSVPRLLMENGQRLIEAAAREDLTEIDEEFVERVLGGVEVPVKEEDVVEYVDDDCGASTHKITYDNFMVELSPTQQDIVTLLLSHESLSISELGGMLSKDIRSMGSLVRKLRGLNPDEVGRKPGVPYPIVVRQGKELRSNRMQYVYSLSDNARRLLAR